jgi:hypothetical protein
MEFTGETPPQSTPLRKSYIAPLLIEHGSVEKIIETVNLPMSRDAQMGGSIPGA